jgi:hypothetical protein
MGIQESIDMEMQVYRARIRRAQHVADELLGRLQHDLVVVEIGDYVVIDDGQSRWLAESSDWECAIREILESVIDGKFDDEIGDYVVIDDGQSRWLAESSDWEFANESQIGMHDEHARELEILELDLAAGECEQILDALGLD